MDFKVPMHAQLREHIREKIEEGEYKYGTAIPSERNFAEMYGLNRMTVRHAIDELVREGILKRIQGKGTFVTKPKIERDVSSLKGFSRMLINKGIKPSSQLIHSEKRKAGYKYAAIFNIDKDEYVYRMLRLRLGDNEPITLEDTYVPYNLIDNIENIDFEVYSLYDLFAANNIELSSSNQTLTLIKIRNGEAKLLNVLPGSTVFLLEYTTVDSKGRALEFTRAYTSGEKSTFYAELT